MFIHRISWWIDQVLAGLIIIICSNLFLQAMSPEVNSFLSIGSVIMVELGLILGIILNKVNHLHRWIPFAIGFVIIAGTGTALLQFWDGESYRLTSGFSNSQNSRSFYLAFLIGMLVCAGGSLPFQKAIPKSLKIPDIKFAAESISLVFLAVGLALSYMFGGKTYGLILAIMGWQTTNILLVQSKIISQETMINSATNIAIGVMALLGLTIKLDLSELNILDPGRLFIVILGVVLTTTFSLASHKNMEHGTVLTKIFVIVKILGAGLSLLFIIPQMYEHDAGLLLTIGLVFSSFFIGQTTNHLSRVANKTILLLALSILAGNAEEIRSDSTINADKLESFEPLDSAIGKWVLAKSSINFEIEDQKGVCKGKFNSFTGTFSCDSALNCAVNLEIDVSSISTRNKYRDESLRSDEYLKTSTYPTIQFVSSSIIKVDNRYEMTGAFTLMGVSQNISIETNYLGKSANQIHFRGTTELDRTKFGMPSSTVIGDLIKVEFNVLFKPFTQQ